MNTNFLQILSENMANPVQVLKMSCFDTPLGEMIAIASEETLYLLEFTDCKGLTLEIERLRHRTQSDIIPGISQPLESIEHELKSWFLGSLHIFTTPFLLMGSPFQKNVWEALCRIPYGETHSYLHQAKAIEKPSACRAVANANGANQLAIIVPCHRIINSNGKLGGYGGGIHRKQWLLNHEKQHRLFFNQK